MDEVPKILLVPDVNEEQPRIIRLGKLDTTNGATCRPIKVTLSSVDNVYPALRNSFKLKTLPKFSGIAMSSNRTSKQIQIYKHVKTELVNRQAKGEANLRIRYKNGTPTIVTYL